MAQVRQPPGWPREVPPAEVPGWERRAESWLLDQCPPEYRVHEVLRRYPVVLARFAAGHVQASQEAASRGLATVRADLRDLLPPEAVEATVGAYEREALRLGQVARAVAMIGQALQGRRYVPRL